MKSWYAAHTHPHGEFLAKSHLERQGFTVYLPRYLKQRRHARRIEMVAAPLFPRYLFIEMDLAQARWRAVHSTVGVQYLVCNGTEPAALPDWVVTEIRTREDESGLVQTVQPSEMKPGDPIHIVSGAFNGHDALFQCTSDRDRIVVLLNLLGRAVRAVVPLDAVGSAVA